MGLRAMAAVLGAALAGCAAGFPARAQDAASSRVYVDLEYLHMWSKDAPIAVPLVSTGPIATTHHGLLGPPENGADSTVLYGSPFPPAMGGNPTQAFAGAPGARLTAGYWLDGARRYAVEASGFWLAGRSAGYTYQSDATGNPVVGIPVYNTTTYLAITPTSVFPVFPGEDSLSVSLPDDPERARSNGIITGHIAIRNTIDVWGAALNATASLYRDPTWSVTGLLGARHLELAEGFGMVTHIVGVTGPYVGEAGTVFDSFKTSNRFYGLNFGLRGRVSAGPWFAELTTQFAPGLSQQTISVQGGYTSVNFGANSGPEGIFAQPSNEGQRSANRFAFVTENALRLGRDLAPGVTLTVGYTHLYYSNVVRPTEQIDRNIPKGQTFVQSAPVISTTNPTKRFQTSSFFTQGVNLGLRVAF